MGMPFLKAIERGGVVGDGAMGSVLYERGVYVNRNFDEINLAQPEMIYKIHRDYLLAGAHLIETNTYGANRVRLGRSGLGGKAKEINLAAADIARRVADDAAWVAGSIGPTGFGPSELRRGHDEAVSAFTEQAKWLTESGCDLLMVETFTQPEELRLAVQSCRAASKLPIVAQIAVGNDGKVIDGTSPKELALEMREWGADVVGANCNGPEVIYDFAVAMLEAGIPVSAFPYAGRPQRIEDRQIYLATPENFGVFARRLFKAGVSLVGGCCGTLPAHITRVSAAARMVWPKRVQTAVTVQEVDAGKEPVPIKKRSRLGEQLGERFLFSVEVNPGHGLSVKKQVAAAKMLKGAGADFINIADGPRATARMSNLALAVEMERQAEVETILHVCCRDRNLLGQQAFLLGAQVQGIRNLCIITGDPPKVGEYPDATAVYDQDSIGLLQMSNSYNRGVDPSGKPMPEQTSFVLATGVEPAAQDFEREIMRLRQKVEAGAELIMTQPIYDPSHLERFFAATTDLDIAVFVGILPLASYRNAEFIHNSIPGMNIPEDTRARMKAAPKGDAAKAEGVKIAVEALTGVRERVAGAYIMPPLGRYEMAAEIIAAF